MTERTRALVPVRQEDAEGLAALGREIWEEHYTSLLGPEQVAYMVEKFQSAPAVRCQMQEEGYRYWFFTVDGQRAGYVGVQPRQDGSLYLSKLYVAGPYRGLGPFPFGLGFLVGLGRPQGVFRLWLPGNK